MKGMSARIDALENLAGDSFAGEAVCWCWNPARQPNKAWRDGKRSTGRLMMRISSCGCLSGSRFRCLNRKDPACRPGPWSLRSSN